MWGKKYGIVNINLWEMNFNLTLKPWLINEKLYKMKTKILQSFAD